MKLPRGYASIGGIGRNIPVNNRAGPDDRIQTDCDSWQNVRASTDQYIGVNYHATAEGRSGTHMREIIYNAVVVDDRTVVDDTSQTNFSIRTYHSASGNKTATADPAKVGHDRSWVSDRKKRCAPSLEQSSNTTTGRVAAYGDMDGLINRALGRQPLDRLPEEPATDRTLVFCHKVNCRGGPALRQKGVDHNLGMAARPDHRQALSRH